MRQPPGRAQRRGGSERKPREERWSELIEVATDVFYAKGYDAASLQDIADRLGMFKGSLYYYIQSKEDLLYDVYRWFRTGGEFTAHQIGEQFADLALRGVATPEALAR
jgi:AcrR family transcriptional regulator